MIYFIRPLGELFLSTSLLIWEMGGRVGGSSVFKNIIGTLT